MIMIFTVGMISPPEENLHVHGTCNIPYVYSRNHVVLKIITRSALLFLVLTVVFYCITIWNVIKMNRQIYVVSQHRAEYVRHRTSHFQNKNPMNLQSASTDCRALRTAWGLPGLNLSPIQLPGVRSAPATEEPLCVRSVSAAEELPAARFAPVAEEYVQIQPPIITQHAQIAALRRKKIMNTIVLVGILMGFLIFLSGPLIISLFFPDLPLSYKNISAGLCGFNSLINPFIYCWKIPEVKDALIQSLRKVFRCSRNETS
jgi:hypothetical protein